MELKAKRSVVIATAIIDGNEIELGHISHFVSTETYNSFLEDMRQLEAQYQGTFVDGQLIHIKQSPGGGLYRFDAATSADTHNEGVVWPVAEAIPLTPGSLLLAKDPLTDVEYVARESTVVKELEPAISNDFATASKRTAKVKKPGRELPTADKLVVVADADVPVSDRETTLLNSDILTKFTVNAPQAYGHLREINIRLSASAGVLYLQTTGLRTQAVKFEAEKAKLIGLMLQYFLINELTILPDSELGIYFGLQISKFLNIPTVTPAQERTLEFSPYRHELSEMVDVSTGKLRDAYITLHGGALTWVFRLAGQQVRLRFTPTKLTLQNNDVCKRLVFHYGYRDVPELHAALLPYVEAEAKLALDGKIAKRPRGNTKPRKGVN